jgi:hypothetical protein
MFIQPPSSTPDAHRLPNSSNVYWTLIGGLTEADHEQVADIVARHQGRPAAGGTARAAVLTTTGEPVPGGH